MVWGTCKADSQRVAYRCAGCNILLHKIRVKQCHVLLYPSCLITISFSTFLKLNSVQESQCGKQGPQAHARSRCRLAFLLPLLLHLESSQGLPLAFIKFRLLIHSHGPAHHFPGFHLCSHFISFPSSFPCTSLCPFSPS